MLETIDLSTVNWSRAQFALTAFYHFLFVPLTLGLSFILAIMETIYFKTKDEFWKRTTKFWAKIFGINFAIGVATGIILEFQFGTNWSNYSWFVGDIFGAPLAVEGIFAFFLEATFFAVLFFGWDKVSKGFHLFSTWMVAFGSNMSALWILVANGWMQYPIATKFNLDLARNEMTSFIDLVLSPMAVTKFLHVITAGYVASAVFVCGISAWFLLKKRHIVIARKSIIVAAAFGFISSIYMAGLGDQSGYVASQLQPMKMAAAEGLYRGSKGQGLLIFGVPNFSKKLGDGSPGIKHAVEIPYLLSLMGHRNPNAFFAGIEDLVYGNEEEGIVSGAEKIARGKLALEALVKYKQYKKGGNEQGAGGQEKIFRSHEKYMGYGHFDRPEELIPPVWTIFTTFHLMVGLGTYFIFLLALMLFLGVKDTLMKRRWILKLAFYSFPLGILTTNIGWAMTEFGRVPWAIQGLMPIKIAATNVSPLTVKLSFFAFLILFTVLLIAEIRIMRRQIIIGPEEK